MLLLLQGQELSQSPGSMSDINEDDSPKPTFLLAGISFTGTLTLTEAALSSSGGSTFKASSFGCQQGAKRLRRRMEGVR